MPDGQPQAEDRSADPFGAANPGAAERAALADAFLDLWERNVSAMALCGTSEDAADRAS